MENWNNSGHKIRDLERLFLLEPELTRVNQHLERLCQSQNPSMQKILQWVLQARGKQLRPILTLLFAKLAGKQVDATEIAAVIEICHTASLLHDDVIDEAELRRGQLSVQKKFGREMAIYAGDFMIFPQSVVPVWSISRGTGNCLGIWKSCVTVRLSSSTTVSIPRFPKNSICRISLGKLVPYSRLPVLQVLMRGNVTKPNDRQPNTLRKVLGLRFNCGTT